MLNKAFKKEAANYTALFDLIVERPLLAEGRHNKKNKAKMGIVTVNEPKRTLKIRCYLVRYANE